MRSTTALFLLCACTAAPADGDDDGDTGGSPTGADTPGDDDGQSATSADDDDDDDAADDAVDDAADTGADDDDGSSTGEPMPPPPTCGALANVPSEPGPHVAEIEALADDTWLALGPPAADPQFGIALGRSWGGRALVLAPDLRGAFYTGEGVHAYVKPDGYGMDDIWFYDLNAHAWIAIHPGVDTAGFNQSVVDGDLSIDDNGQLQDAYGNPVPLHVLIHAWDYLTYDTATQRFVFLAGDGMGRYYMPGLDQIDAGLTMLEAQRATKTIPPMSPWSWSTADCVFEREPIASPTPDIGGFAAFVYASATDQYVYAGAAGVALFDRDAGTWTVVEDSGPRPTGYDHGVAYDAMRNRLYMGAADEGSYGMFVYDIGTSTWTNPASSASGPGSFRTNSASIFHDSVNDVVTVFHYETRVHWTYDPVADTWTSQPMPDEVIDAIGYPSFNAFYDAQTNAYFVYAASDSGDNGTMFAYRWRTP